MRCKPGTLRSWMFLSSVFLAHNACYAERVDVDLGSADRSVRLAASYETKNNTTEIDGLISEMSSTNDVRQLTRKIVEITNMVKQNRIGLPERRRYAEAIEQEFSRALLVRLKNYEGQAASWRPTLESMAAANTTFDYIGSAVTIPMNNISKLLDNTQMSRPFSEVKAATAEIEQAYIDILNSKTFTAILEDALLGVTITGNNAQPSLTRELFKYVSKVAWDDPDSAIRDVYSTVLSKRQFDLIDLQDISVGGPSGQPNAKEMLRAAVDATIRENKKARVRSQECKDAFQKGITDPFCIGFALGTPPQIRIVEFVKVACGKPTEGPGFVCDYQVRGDVTGSFSDAVKMMPVFGTMLQSLSSERALFTETKNGWLYSR